MEIEMGPFPRFEDVKKNAYWANIHIDTRFTADREDMGSYIAHLQDCENHPTTGLLARRKYITGKKRSYPGCAKLNMHILEAQPEVDKLIYNINEKMNSKDLYPRTKHIRQYIIDQERVVLDYVKRAKKYSLKDKLFIISKRLFNPKWKI